MKKRNFIGHIFLSLILLNVIVWLFIVFDQESNEVQIYFLDVGQGDSQLVDLGRVEILIDGGRSKAVLDELAKIMPMHDRYIDLVVMTHPDSDHFAGLIDVLKNYQVGALIGTGRKGDTNAYAELMQVIRDNNIPYIVVGEGDGIKYGSASFSVLGPRERNLYSFNINDSSIVLLFKKGDFTVLFTGDASSEIERELVQKYNLAADVLKIGHHGSKYSSDYDFLRAVKPKIAIIEVGKNSYGHPALQVLDRLAAVGAQVLRTDELGTIKLRVDDGLIRAYAKQKTKH